jgi:hypothetical protein
MLLFRIEQCTDMVHIKCLGLSNVYPNVDSSTDIGLCTIMFPGLMSKQRVACIPMPDRQVDFKYYWSELRKHVARKGQENGQGTKCLM